jgi:hypothetical protein
MDRLAPIAAELVDRLVLMVVFADSRAWVPRTLVHSLRTVMTA